MNFKIMRSQFLDGLKTVQNIVPSKGALQIIQNILIEAKDKQLRGRERRWHDASGEAVAEYHREGA